MKHEVTTQELLELTGINPRTFTNWTRKLWLPPWIPGRGRGHQNLFDLYAVAWAMTLSEIFRLWPEADTPVQLGSWQPVGEGYSYVWSKTVLSDGAGILKFLRAPNPFLHQGTVVLLAQGIIDGTRDRFAEVRISGHEKIRPWLDDWLNSGAPMTILEPTGPNEPSKVITAMTEFSYHQNLTRVENKAKWM
jgi:hypothetical protein